MPIAIEVVTQEKLIFSEPEADMILVPATEGTMGVLPHHAPVLTTLTYGELVVKKGRAEESFAIYGGVVDIRPDKVVVLADLAESSYNIDADAMQAARDRAEKALTAGAEDANKRGAVLELRRAELALKIQRRVQNRSILRIVEETEE